jgi:hypothetical protein
VLVSSTVKDHVAGSALRFEPRGEHQLKGIADPWRVLGLAPSQSGSGDSDESPDPGSNQELRRPISWSRPDTR